MPGLLLALKSGKPLSGARFVGENLKPKKYRIKKRTEPLQKIQNIHGADVAKLSRMSQARPPPRKGKDAQDGENPLMDYVALETMERAGQTLGVTQTPYHAPRMALPPALRSALEKLQRLFAGALHDAKFNSCHSSWHDIKQTKTAKKKVEIFDERFEQWREGSANAIREWLPKFLDLATAYPEVIDDPIHWAKDSVWEGVEGVCGIQRPQDGEPLSIDWVVNKIIVWWFAVASEGSPKVNLSPLRPWRAPRWLARDRRETEDVLRKRTGYLWLRVNRAIEDEIALAEIRRASNRKVEEYKAAFSGATQGSKPEGPMAAQRKQSGPAPTAPSVVDPFAALKPGETVVECSPLSAEDTDTTGPAIRLLQKLGFSAEWPPPSCPITADLREKLERARRVVQARGVLVDGEPLNPLADGRSWVMPCKLPDDLSKREDAPDQVRRWLESEGVKVAARPVWQNGKLLSCGPSRLFRSW